MRSVERTPVTASFPGSLITLNGTLYGVAFGGGDKSCGNYGLGCGAIFSLTPSGDLNVLHRFRGTLDHGPDGYTPTNIVSFNGVLYGITTYGGRKGNGTVFSVTTSGEERVLYSFGNYKSGDGGDPNSLPFSMVRSTARHRMVVTSLAAANNLRSVAA